MQNRMNADTSAPAVYKKEWNHRSIILGQSPFLNSLSFIWFYILALVPFGLFPRLHRFIVFFSLSYLNEFSFRYRKKIKFRNSGCQSILLLKLSSSKSENSDTKFKLKKWNEIIVYLRASIMRPEDEFFSLRDTNNFFLSITIAKQRRRDNSHD